jgi:hypothetical protein
VKISNNYAVSIFVLLLGLVFNTQLFIFTRVGTHVQRGSTICFVVLVVLVVETLVRILHYCPISPCFQHIAPLHAPLPCSLARQPYLAALPGSLARQPCSAALPSSSTNFDRI